MILHPSNLDRIIEGDESIKSNIYKCNVKSNLLLSFNDFKHAFVNC